MAWRVVRQIGVIVALALVAVILWVDIATGLWQDYVVLSGLAAGVVTFVLTALVVDRVVARSTHERWAPVTRLAISDILHALADDELSEIAHGRIAPRQFSPVLADSTESLSTQVTRVRRGAVGERQRLASALASWSTFLASSADATDVLDQTAEIAERLDLIRDAAMEVGHPALTAQVHDLNVEISMFNTAVQSLVVELQRLIESTNKISSHAVSRDRMKGAADIARKPRAFGRTQKGTASAR